MKTHKVLAVGVVMAGILLLLQATPAVLAQDQDQDPPSRVARLNYSSGSVSFQPGGEGDWVEAVNNRPITSGDNLWADKDSRAELHVGSTAIRLNSETSVTFLDLDDHTLQLRLSAGSIVLRVRHIDDGDTFEVDTPNLAFDVQRTGEYRIDVNPDGNETLTTVWKGRGEVTGGGESYTVLGGQQARFSGTDQLDHEISQLPQHDDFDEWAFDRDQHEDRSESSNYISSEMTGAEDLDDYGHWRYVAGYGTVWAPAGIAPGWAPYRNGHWVFVAPWGWTWVEDEPWGFAPFHYGRWAYVEDGWCWVPGPGAVRPVYSPALVAFVGGGGFSLSLSFGGGGVAWFPLAPGEVYVPPYRVSREYVNTINVTNTRVNVTQITNVYNVYNTNTTNTHITYVNQRVPTGVTAVSHDTFVRAQPVARNLVQVDARKISEAPVSHDPRIQPDKVSVLGAGRPVSVRPPERVLNREVVASHNPAPPRPAFEPRQGPSNTRPEAPVQPQPGNRALNENPRPQPPANNPPESRPVPRPPSSGRPQDMNRPPESGRPQPPDNQRPDNQRPAPRPSADNPPRPLVRPAPPVQERPEHQQNEEQKFRQWEQQRPKPEAPRPPEPSRQPPPSQHPAARPPEPPKKPS